MATCDNVPLASQIEEFVADMTYVETFVETSALTATTPQGTVRRTIAGAVAEMDADVAAVDAAATSALTNIAADVLSVQTASDGALAVEIPAQIARLGLQYPPIAYTAGLTLDSNTKTYSYLDALYIWGGALGTITTGAFDEDGWQPIQGDIQLRNDVTKGTSLIRDVKHVASVAALRLLPGEYDGQTIHLISYYDGWAATTQGAVGGGEFIWSSASTDTDDSGIFIQVTDVTTGRWRRVIGGEINPYIFGARGDGIADDRPPIQSCLDKISSVGGGLELNFPPAPSFYAIKTENPSYPGHGLVVTSSPGGGNIIITGSLISGRVVLATPSNITSLMYWPVTMNLVTMKNLWLDAANKADYVLKANEQYHPFVTMEQVYFRQGLQVCMSLSTFVSTLTNVQTFRGQKGFEIKGIGGGPVTSTTMNSCYALQAKQVGYDLGYLTYCVLNSCACDGTPDNSLYHTELAYSFTSAYGVTMNSCGSEGTKRLLKATAFRGLTVNSPFMLSAGDAVTPVDYLIELVGGFNATIGGLQVQSQLAAGFNYKLGVTSSAAGAENVTVLDNSILRSEAYSVSNFRFERPIRFLRGDESQKSETINISNATELLSRLSSYNNYTINDSVVLQLADGIYNVNTITSNIKNLKGNGTLTIQGNSSNRAAVKLQSDFDTLKFTDCSLKIVFKNLTVGGVTSNNSNRRMQLINCPKLVLDNVDISRDGLNTGNAILMSNGSKVTLINGSVATGPFAGPSFNADASSEVIIAPATTFPATGTWVAGNKLFNSAPTAGGNVGWVFISAAVGWKTFGAIGA